MRRTCTAWFANSYLWIALPHCGGPSVLTAALGRFAADADTAPGFRERLHNRSASRRCAGPGGVAVHDRRATETGSPVSCGGV